MSSNEGRIISINTTRNQLLSEIKRILSDFNLRPFKSYSQNFVIEPKLIRWHLQYSNLEDDDIVIEIGAGLGTLTKFLAAKVKRVIAIERDPKFIEVLHEELAAHKNVEIIEGDVLKLEPKIFAGNKIVSNPPYKISSPLTFKIIQSSYRLSVMSYQKEFAERMIATPGSKNYGRITLGVKYYATVELLQSIPRNYFYPSPKVDSALIRLTPSAPPFPLTDEKEFFDFVRNLYFFRNKSVRRALSLYLKHSELKEIQMGKFENSPIANERIFRLSLKQFHELYQLIKPTKED